MTRTRKPPTNKATPNKSKREALRAIIAGGKDSTSGKDSTTAKPSAKLKGSKAPKSSDADLPWLYAAAAACFHVAEQADQATPKRRPQWGDGDGVAEALVIAARKGPDALAQLETLYQATDKRNMPEDFEGFAEAAKALFALAGFGEDYSHLEPRKVYEFSPYHVHLCTDPKHPMYDRRCSRPANEELAASIDAVGEVVDVGQVTPYEDKDGVTRLYTGSGSRRNKAHRLANARRLHRWFQKHSWAPVGPKSRATPPPPELILTYQAKVYLPGKQRQMAASVANQMRLAEDIVREAESVEALVKSGWSTADIARSLGKDQRTVQNLQRLTKLDAKLLDEVAAGKLDVACAYRLAAEPNKKRQREAAEATAHYKVGVRRREAIEAFLAGKELPSADPSAKPVPQKRVLEAARLLKDAAEDEVKPYSQLLAALAGEPEALAALPEVVRKALGPQAKLDPELARWVKAGFTVDEAKAWMAAGVDMPSRAKEISEYKVTPAMLQRRASDKLIETMRREDAEMLGEEALPDDDDYFMSTLPNPPILGALWQENFLAREELLAELREAGEVVAGDETVSPDDTEGAAGDAGEEAA